MGKNASTFFCLNQLSCFFSSLFSQFRKYLGSSRNFSLNLKVWRWVWCWQQNSIACLPAFLLPNLFGGCLLLSGAGTCHVRSVICQRPRSSPELRGGLQTQKGRRLYSWQLEEGKREVNVVSVPQHQFRNCSFALVVNQPLSEATCCGSREKEDSWSLKKKKKNQNHTPTKSEAKGLCHHYQSWINKSFLWLSWKWVRGEITAWRREHGIQPLMAVMLLYLESFIL